jgi:hypothetical protein
LEDHLGSQLEHFTMRDSDPETISVPTTRGRPFANGNPGRKRGSKNRTTIVATALVDGEAEELVRKAVELAKAGRSESVPSHNRFLQRREIG